MKGVSARRVIVPFVVAACAIYLPKTVWPHSTLYVDVLSPPRLRLLGLAAKLFCLGVGTVFGFRSAARFESSNPARWPWLAIGAWLALWTVGQLVFTLYPLVVGSSPPVVSAGDLFFLVGYVPLFVGQIRFISVYRASGLPVGSARQHLLLAAGAAAVLGPLAVALLAAPSVPSDTTLAERLVTLFYPVFDLAALVPTIVMLRIALAFRPGKVWAVWAALLAGFASMAAGDVVSAFVWSVEEFADNPWIHLTYLLGYFFVACGTRLQYELLAE
jgi:hypothetical protein